MSTAYRKMKTHTFLGLIIVLILGSGCGDAIIDPFKNDGNYFTIYGYLDALRGVHEVRVIPVTRRPQKIVLPDNPAGSIDAKVRSINLTTGEVTNWDHSLRRLDDGTYGHLFRASFALQGSSYRLEVERSDGRMTYAETHIPKIAELDFIKLKKVFASADDSTEIYQDIHLPAISSPWGIEVTYSWEILNRRYKTTVPYNRSGQRTDDGSWDFRLDLYEDKLLIKEDMDAILAPFEDPERIYRYLTGVGIEFRVLGENWDPPEGIFDPVVLIDPYINTNVVNGYGLWGAMGWYSEEWTVCDLSAVLGFTHINKKKIDNPNFECVEDKIPEI